MHNVHHINDKSIRAVIYEIKDEFREFATTRLAILREELREKKGRIKAAVPMLIGAAVIAGLAAIALTFGLIAVIAAAIDSPYSWAIGAGIVFALYLLIGGILGWVGYKEITTEGLAPQRTLRVLKQDQAWIQSEARSA